VKTKEATMMPNSTGGSTKNHIEISINLSPNNRSLNLLISEDNKIKGRKESSSDPRNRSKGCLTSGNTSNPSRSHIIPNVLGILFQTPAKIRVFLSKKSPGKGQLIN
jgi:hypothetical protein